MVLTIIVVLAALAVLALAGYLAACAGADHWLTLRAWWGQASCPHRHGRLLAIEYDGVSVYECAACGKHIRKPL